MRVFRGRAFCVDPTEPAGRSSLLVSFPFRRLVFPGGFGEDDEKKDEDRENEKERSRLLTIV